VNRRLAAIVKPSEHALGGIYLDPRDPDSEENAWVPEAWAWILAEDALRTEATEPSWLDRPALSRFTASHPRLLEPFKRFNQGRLYGDQVKPYGFLLIAHVAPGGAPLPNSEATPFVLVAPYEGDAGLWNSLPWRNIYDAESPTYTLATSSVFDRGGYVLATNEVAVITYRDVLRSFRDRPETKSDDRHGRPCHKQSFGLLQRRPVQAITPIAHIGKEANFLDEVAAGLVARESDALTVYVDRRNPAWEHYFLPILREMNVRETAAAVGVNPTTITRLRRGAHPRRSLQAALTREVGRYAQARLREGGMSVYLDDEAAAALYLRFKSTATSGN
jgi:hypothetical protein